MLLNTFLASSLVVAVALAVAEPAPYRVGSMSLNPAFGLPKRQAGYQPTQHLCGPGATCAEGCGADYITCPSSDGELHCYDPVIKQTCCTDGTGNSCSDGYYCTQDSTGGSWCCPDGLSLAACAAAYSLTGTLVSEASTAAATIPVSISSSVIVTTAVPPIITGSSSSIVTPYVPSSTGVAYSSMNVTAIISPTQSTPAQFTGAANANGPFGGMLALFVAGFLATL